MPYFARFLIISCLHISVKVFFCNFSLFFHGFYNLSRWIINRFLLIIMYFIMIPVSKGQKAVRACTIRLLNLGHAKYEKVAICAVNQRISNIWRIAEAAEQSGASNEWQKTFWHSYHIIREKNMYVNKIMLVKCHKKNYAVWIKYTKKNYIYYLYWQI